MRIIRFLLLAAFVSCSFIPAGAQGREVAFSAGVNVPMYKGAGNDLMLGMDYSWFRRSGLGFRAGIQWTESISNVDDSFGVPLAVVYRTISIDTPERLAGGFAGAADAVWSGNSGLGVVGAFLLGLISDFEFFAGVTPGYTAGSSSLPSRDYFAGGWQEDWTEKYRDFFFSLDAGFSLNYRIWRFRLKLMPAFHYNLIGNCASRYMEAHDGSDGPVVTADESRPLRWFFTFNGALAYSF